MAATGPVTLPRRSDLAAEFRAVRDALSYYGTMGHETIHWSGAKHRLNRDLGGRFGHHAYAMEELVAELGIRIHRRDLGIR